MKIRDDLEPLPLSMSSLEVDDRGYPVPWFVPKLNGVPEFRGMDVDKFARAVRERRCWVCGDRRGVYVAFVVGPMCGINRISSEPPSHLACARWSARNCPFLSNPRMVRREDEVSNNLRLAEDSAGTALARNPGVALLWITRQFEIIKDPLKKGYLFQMGEPYAIEFWCEKRLATREEIDASITGGLPSLEAVARAEGGLEALAREVAAFRKLLDTQSPHAKPA
jgi:hypothetical protein